MKNPTPTYTRAEIDAAKAVIRTATIQELLKQLRAATEEKRAANHGEAA